LRQSDSGQGRRHNPETDRFRGLPVVGFAVAGLVLGHALSYVITVPDPYHRDLLLQHTGHHYFPAFGQTALMLFLAAIAAVVFRTSRRSAGRAGRFAPLAAQLALVQIGAFTAQELLERTVSGSGFADLRDGRILLVGVTAQIAVALIGAALLRWLARASDRLGQVLGSGFPLPRPLPAFALPLSADRASGHTEVVSHGQRAPPSA
jgi:hypothetical protein